MFVLPDIFLISKSKDDKKTAQRANIPLDMRMLVKNVIAELLVLIKKPFARKMCSNLQSSNITANNLPLNDE